MKSLGLIICAAGDSQRFRSHPENPGCASKLLIRWEGHAMIVHTLRALRALQPQQIVLAFRAGDEEVLQREIEDGGFELGEDFQLVVGGKTRQESVRKALEALREHDLVAIHDGARPFVSPQLLEGMREATEKLEAMVPVLPVTETLKEASSEGWIQKTHDRDKLFRAQTPQIFPMKVMKSLHEKYKDHEPSLTDDCMLFELENLPVMAVEGEARNLKVTLPSDLELMGIRPE